MGTLDNQSPRNYYDIEETDIEYFLGQVNALSDQFKMVPKDVISAISVLEHRRQNNLYVSSGDNMDENLGGFAKILKEHWNL